MSWKKYEVLNTWFYHSADCAFDHSLVVSSFFLKPKSFHQLRINSKKIDVSKVNIPDLQKNILLRRQASIHRPYFFLMKQSIVHGLTPLVPQQLKDAKITTLYKNKSDRGDCNNYPGISLLNVTGKVLAKIIFERLQRLADQVYLEPQCGFREQKPTTNKIFSIRQIQVKSREQRVSLHIAFVDFTKAFDLADRESIYTVLLKSGCFPTFFALIRSFHDGIQVTVQVNGQISKPFSIKKRN